MTKITVDAASLAKLIAEGVAQALAAQGKGGKQAASKTKPNTLVDGKTERQLQMEIETVKAFKRKGLKEAVIQPRVNVLTFNRWVEKGFKVKEGEKAVKVKNLRLFHETQVRPLTEDEKAKIELDNEAAIASHAAAQEAAKQAPQATA